MSHVSDDESTIFSTNQQNYIEINGTNELQSMSRVKLKIFIPSTGYLKEVRLEFNYFSIYDILAVLLYFYQKAQAICKDE